MVHIPLALTDAVNVPATLPVWAQTVLALATFAFTSWLTISHERLKKQERRRRRRRYTSTRSPVHRK
jgi:hypothetical protein